MLAIESGRLVRFDGSYPAYLAAKKLVAAPPVQEEREKKTDGYRSKEDRAREARRRTRTREIEMRMEALDAEEEAINASLMNTADYREAQALTTRIGEIQTERETLYAEYEELI